MNLNSTDGQDQFKKIAWPFLADLLRVARILTRDAFEAEDLVQDSLLKAWRAFGSFRMGTDIRAWLLTILRRTHIDHLRYNGRHVTSFSLEDDSSLPPAEVAAPPPDDLDERWNDAHRMMEQFDDADITEALRALPDDIRWTILLVHVEQLDHEQAAAIMEVPVGTVKSRAFRGRRLLKKWLTEAASSRTISDDQCDWCEAPRDQCSPEVSCSPSQPCPAACAT